MEAALLVPLGGSADRTLVAMKLTGYFSLGYTTISQDQDGSHFCPGQSLRYVHSQNTEIRALLSPLQWVSISRLRTHPVLWLRSGNWQQHPQSHIKPSKFHRNRQGYTICRQNIFFSVIYSDYVIRLQNIESRFFLRIRSWPCCYVISSIYHTEF